jgi:hypothetical protein
VEPHDLLSKESRERVPSATMSAYWPACAMDRARAVATRIGGGFSGTGYNVALTTL